MTERRFNEAEVAAIFERATEAPPMGQHQLPSGEGMTLAELQAIGREVGISPEQLARAAKAIELGGQPTSRQFLGFPVVATSGLGPAPPAPDGGSRGAGSRRRELAAHNRPAEGKLRRSHGRKIAFHEVLDQ